MIYHRWMSCAIVSQPNGVQEQRLADSKLGDTTHRQERQLFNLAMNTEYAWPVYHGMKERNNRNKMDEVSCT